MIGNNNSTVNDWKIFDVSLIGPKHQRAKIPNQDSATSVHLKYCDIIIVADGLGSCKLSHIGSQTICRSVIKVCKLLEGSIENINPLYFLRMVHTLWLMLLQEQPIKECGTTCLICIKTKAKVYVFTLGDGMVATLDSQYNVHFLMPNVRDFGNMTNALNSEFNQSDWSIFEFLEKDILMVMMCTDGIADDIHIDKQELWVKDFYEHYHLCESKYIANDIRKWLKKWSVKNHHDDKSISCMIR